MTSITLTHEEVERFWAKVDKSGECWLWTAYKARNGYGRFSVQQKPTLAHRISYSLATGELPQILDHKCRVRACVNPEHLRPATFKENRENLSGAQRGSKSGVRGVSWSAHSKKWRADVTHNNKQTLLGYFGTIEEAEAAAVARRNELFTHNDADRTVA
jgi:hypothetical protein